MNRTTLFLSVVIVASATMTALVPGGAAASTTGSGFGVTPVELRFVDPPLLRGNHVEGLFHVQNRQGTDITVTPSPEGAIAQWMTLDPASSFVVKDGETRDVKVALTIPDDAANGDYVSYLRLRSTPSSNMQGSGSSLAVELVPAVRVKVGGEQTIKLAMDALDVKNAEAGGPLALTATLVNQGNVRYAPTLDVTVMDGDSNPLFEEKLVGDVLEPRAGGPSTFVTEHALPTTGTFLVKAALLGNGQTFDTKQLTFEAVARGANGEAPKLGKFTVLGLDTAAEAGSPAKITAGFKNLGTTAVHSAKLVGEVYLGDKRVALLASDPLAVNPGEEQSLEAFFTPKDAGVYKVVSYVTFDGVKSATKQDNLKVASSESAPGGNPPATSGSPGGASDKSGASAPAAVNKTPLPAVLFFAALGIAAFALRARRNA